MYDRGKQEKYNKYIVIFIVVMMISVFTVYVIECANPDTISQDWGTIRICGYCKAAITLVKYMP